MTLQIAIDCADPHALVAFWAEAFGYEPETHDGLIRQLLEEGHATEADVLELDGHLAWREAAAATHPTYPRVLFQVVPEGKEAKNRVHLDFRLEGDRDAQVERLLGLGATKLWDGRQGPQTWVTMADPEGNEFCVV